MTIEETFSAKKEKPTYADLAGRMDDLRRYGSMVKTVVEFGLRDGYSTISFLAGGASVTSYDLKIDEFKVPDDCNGRWKGVIGDTSRLNEIPECDLLFIDSAHTRAQVSAELKMARFVKQFILFHDVIKFGWEGEGPGEGIMYAILDFLRDSRGQWNIREMMVDEWGILALERNSQ